MFSLLAVVAQLKQAVGDVQFKQGYEQAIQAALEPSS